MKKELVALISFIVVFCLPVISLSAKGSKMSLVPAERIVQSLKEHIDKKAEGNDGYYPLHDPKAEENLLVDLEGISENSVSYIPDENLYRVNANFTGADEKNDYAVTFWLKKNAQGKFIVAKSKIFKKDGEKRYTYQKKGIVVE